MIRILFQLSLIALPFVMFGFYRMATAHTRTSREAWPKTVLLIIGLSISACFWVFLWFSGPHEKRTCATPPRFENGKIVQGDTVPCENASIDSRD